MYIFKGFYPALLTPYKEDGSVCAESMEKHVNSLIEQGADGFYVNGSTGEGLLLSENERKEMAEAVIRAAKGRAKVIVHVGAMSLPESCRLAEHAAKIGADAVSSLPPLYYKYTFPQIKLHYSTIAVSAGIPMIVYNIPSYSGVSFTSAQLEELASIHLVTGIKHSSPNLYELERIKAQMPDFTVFYGMDEQYIAARLMGADAAIGSTYNFILPIFGKMNGVSAEKAVKIQKRANDFIEAGIKNDLMPTLKYLIEKRTGIPFGGCRAPMTVSLSAEQKKAADALYEGIKDEL